MMKKLLSLSAFLFVFTFSQAQAAALGPVGFHFGPKAGLHMGELNQKGFDSEKKPSYTAGLALLFEFFSFGLETGAYLTRSEFEFNSMDSALSHMDVPLIFYFQKDLPVIDLRFGAGLIYTTGVNKPKNFADFGTTLTRSDNEIVVNFGVDVDLPILPTLTADLRYRRGFRDREKNTSNPYQYSEALELLVGIIF